MRIRHALALCLCATAVSGCARSRVETLSLVADRPPARSLWPWSGRKSSSPPAASSKLKPKQPSERTSSGSAAEKTREQVEEFLRGLDPELRQLIDEELADVVPETERERLLQYLTTVEPERIQSLILAKRRDRLKREQQAAARERELVEATAPALPEALEQPEGALDPVVPITHETPVAVAPPRPPREAVPSLTLLGVEEEPDAEEQDVAPVSEEMVEPPVTAEPPLEEIEGLPPESPEPTQTAMELPPAEADAESVAPSAPNAPSRFSRLKSWEPWKPWNLTKTPEAEPAPPVVEADRSRPTSAAGAISRLSAGMLGGTPPVTAQAPAPAAELPAPRVDLDATYVQEEIQRLIALMEGDTSQLKPGATFAEREDYIRRHALLRMLYLMANEPQLAQQAIPGVDAPTQEFWTSLMWGMSNYFDSEGIPDPADRTTLTLAQLRAAELQLQGSARLEIHSLTFCDRIEGFGVYHPFERDVFRAGQPVLLYGEVRNFQSQASPDGYRTVLRSTIEILRSGPDGELVERRLLEPTEDLSRSLRNDYFHSYKLDLPAHLTPGPHTVRLTVEDEQSGKMATSTIDFLVR